MFAFSPISPTGMIVILVVALILFGSRLPEVARSMGRAVNEFKRGLKEVSDDVSDNPEKLNPPSDQPNNTVQRTRDEQPPQQ